MLDIVVPATELWDERNEVFLETKEQKLRLEHSLVSLAKWEQKHKVPLLNKETITYAEMADYIRCMTITQNVDPIVYRCLSKENFEQVETYMNDSMTATKFYTYGEEKKRNPKRPSGKTIVTNELIYYWMFSLGVDKHCETWHLNRLLTLIQVFNVKNNPKKMSKQETAKMYSDINKARRAKIHTKG